MNIKNISRVARLTAAAISAGLIAASLSTVSVATVGQTAAPPSFAHVVIVVMENTAYSSIIGNTVDAPYINRLAAQYSYTSNYFAVSHPSLPNYLALTGANTFGINSDCAPAVCPVNATNLMDRIEGAGLTWKAYMEGMPSSCDTTDAYPYAVKHDPFVYYNDIRNNSARCQSHVVPFTQQSGDFASASTTPNFSWITPNMCNDTHDCSIATGDAWLSTQIPAILGSPAFTTQNSLLLLTWDEDDSSGNNHVALIAAGPQVRAGFVSNVAYTHYSILSTLESGWNLAALNSNDSTASPMTDLVSGGSSSPPCTALTVSPVPTSSALPGASVVFTASASGCSNPTYEFWILAPGGTWTIVQAYSTSATYTWHTVGDPAGTYLYTVWARDANSSNNLDAFFPGTAYTLTSQACASVTVSATPASPQVPGTAATLGASASGCPNPRYQFWILPPGGAWTIVQAYSTIATFNWSTIGDPSGTYLYTVWVRDATSGANLDGYSPGTAFTLMSTSCSAVTASAAPASPRASGTTVTITASGSGCPNPQYEFWILPSGGSWTIVQAYSSSATFTWRTIGDPRGTYLWTVWVRDAGSTGTLDAYSPGTAYKLT